MLLAGFAPWWIILETTGRRSGRPRRIPVAKGLVEGDTWWILAAHGRKAQFVRNVEATPSVRIKHLGRWRTATATVEPLDPALLSRFNFYARGANTAMAIDPLLVRVELD